MDDASPSRSTYHHGHLKQALIEAAIGLIEEKGPESVTVAEAGKRAGVSSGAPFRHFESRMALMTAVAEVFQTELMERMERAHGGALGPREALRRMGLAYLHWGLDQPTHFRMFSNRHLFDLESSAALLAGEARLEALVEGSFRLLIGGAEGGTRVRRLTIDSRALLTGLVSLYCHGQLERLKIEGESTQITLERSWELFLESVQPPRGEETGPSGFDTLAP